MIDIGPLRKMLIERILDGEGVASRAQRHAAFDNAGLTGPLKSLVDKVAMGAHRITDSDIAALRASGLSEDQIFEMVVCAAVGQSVRQYDSARAALELVGKEGGRASLDP